MKPLMNTWLLSKKAPLNLHQNLRKNFPMKFIHSARISMTSQEIATALRPFIFTVHPDRFWNFPIEKNTNEISLKRLNEFLGERSTGKCSKIRDEIITFYIRNASSSSSSPEIDFKKVNIKLNSMENLSTTVHRILSQCSLPTEYLKSINKKPIDLDYQSNGWRNSNQKEFFYNKELFDDIESDFIQKRGEMPLSQWLKDNHQSASSKLGASVPIRNKLARLKQEITEKLQLKSLEWNCDWAVSHVRGALKNLIILSNQHPDEFRKLRSKMIVLGRHNGVGIDGQIVLNVEDVRDSWLQMIRSINRFDYYVKQLPKLEKQLSDLIGGVSIVHLENNLCDILSYYASIERFIRSIKEFESSQNSSISWPDSLSAHKLMIDFNSGSLALSSNGNFIVPATCSIDNLVKFINDNMHEADDKLNQEEFNLEHERVLKNDCMETFQFGCLDRHNNIKTEQMISFCRNILDNKDKLKDYLSNTHLHVSMYYSVMHDGQICVPFNCVV
ncbi:T-cell activation inhibitor [Sarcoptes scabiei]|uniref:T-cell activation inhibitor, mitochondrial n=1 Tax=Sarcoptes scabiei TaxID=52283 RepID=A0A834VES1_SARSC|nr:T-cell activation inhibitor [Sarcoptes scabiei]